MTNDSSNNKPVVAAFDFDGTITYCDSLVPFLLLTAGPIQSFFNAVLLIPELISFASGKKTRTEVKEAILTCFFRSKSLSELKQLGSRYALGRLNKLVRPAALERIQWHRRQGHRCVLISASLDIYLEPWTHQIGFNDLLSSRLAIDSQGKATGKLIGLNCRGIEKVRRLEELLGKQKNYTLYAYGDSPGDKELLAYADHGYYRDMPKGEP